MKFCPFIFNLIFSFLYCAQKFLVREIHKKEEEESRFYLKNVPLIVGVFISNYYCFHLIAFSEFHINLVVFKMLMKWCFVNLSFRFL